MLATVSKYGRAVGFAVAEMQAELQAEEEVVLAAVTQDGHVLQHASAEMWVGKFGASGSGAHAQHGGTTRFTLAELHDNKAAILVAVSQFGYAL